MSTSVDVTDTANRLADSLTLSEKNKSAIAKRDLTLPYGQQHKLAFVLENVMTKEECKAYIKKTEKMGYEKALLNTGGGRQQLRTDIRNSYRCIWDSVEEADKLWQRIKPFIPVDFKSGYEPFSLNERLRFLRYDPGEYFLPHYDGCYFRDNGERSFITFQSYLNEGFEGGNTTFLGITGSESYGVIPKTGSVLVFQHDMYHEGSKLIKGRKYAMRTDVMFKKVSE